MKRGLLALLTLSVLLIGFASADTISLNYITGNDVISSANPSISGAVYNNENSGYTGLGISMLFPFFAPIMLEYNLVADLINGRSITGNTIINPVSHKEITIGMQKDTVSSINPGSAISEAGDNSVSTENKSETASTSNHNSEVNNKIEKILRGREKTKITAEIIGTQSNVQIKEEFYTISTAQTDIIAEIISKFSIDKENASSLLEVETGEGENEEEDQQGVNEENKLKIEVNVNNKFSRVSIEKEFILNTTDREEILNSIVSESLLTADEIKNAMEIKDLKDVIREEHRLKFGNIQCPTSCECTGSVVRCEFENGTRIMTIYAGKSGNIIVQIKGENMTTNVTLYKSEDKFYGVFAGNDTREVKVLPDGVKNNIKAKIKAQLHEENVTLDDNGTYQYEAEKQARLFLIIPVKVPVQAHVDSETGTVSNVQSPWWSALAKDEQ